MEGLAQRFNQLTREESEALARRDELQAWLRSLQQRQGKTISSPLALARVRAEIGAAEALVEEQTKAAQLLARQDALRGKVRHADP